MGHKTTLRDVSGHSPRRPWIETKGITARTGPRQRVAKRELPVEHNLGDPIVIARPPVELRRAVRKAAKRAKRRAMSAIADTPQPASSAEHETHTSPSAASPAAS